MLLNLRPRHPTLMGGDMTNQVDREPPVASIAGMLIRLYPHRREWALPWDVSYYARPQEVAAFWANLAGEGSRPTLSDRATDVGRRQCASSN